ncbi:hypothetical protein ACEN9R_18300, partial [Curtobacterium sp. CT11-133]
MDEPATGPGASRTEHHREDAADAPRAGAVPAGPVPVRPRRPTLTAVFVVFTLSGLDIATWLGRIPRVRDSLGASTFEMGPGSY